MLAVTMTTAVLQAPAGLVPHSRDILDQQHPLDVQNIERALHDIRRIEATLKLAIPHMSHAEATAGTGELEEHATDDIDAAILAQTEAEEERAELELRTISRRAAALGSTRHSNSRPFISAGRVWEPTHQDATDRPPPRIYSVEALAAQAKAAGEAAVLAAAAARTVAAVGSAWDASSPPPPILPLKSPAPLHAPHVPRYSLPPTHPEIVAEAAEATPPTAVAVPWYSVAASFAFAGYLAIFSVAWAIACCFCSIRLLRRFDLLRKPPMELFLRHPSPSCTGPLAQGESSPTSPPHVIACVPDTSADAAAMPAAPRCEAIDCGASPLPIGSDGKQMDWRLDGEAGSHAIDGASPNDQPASDLNASASFGVSSQEAMACTLEQQRQVEGLLRLGKPALSVSESKRVADFLARHKELLILCAGSEGSNTQGETRSKQ